jgi:DNA-binding response OmpR family regulator
MARRLQARPHGLAVMAQGRTPNRDRVLIVETDELIRELIARWLGEAGFEVVTDEAQAAGVALVIVDVPDPARADGALQAIRSRHAVPILATSGRFRRDAAASKSTARRLGVSKALAKPFTGEELMAAVAECLGAKG